MSERTVEGGAPLPAASWRARGSAVLREGFTRSAGGMVVGFAGRALLQGVLFLLVGRELGARAFGATAAVLALGALVAPFASLGAVHLLIRAAARSPRELARQLSSAVVITAVGGLVATGVATALCAGVVRSVPSAAAAELLAGDLVGGLLVEVAAGAATARGRVRRTSAGYAAFHAARLLGALGLATAPAAFTLRTWAPVYGATSVAAALVVVLLALADAGWARPALSEQLGQWRDGLLFSLGLASQAMYNDLDKALLADLSTLRATGAYAAAYRVVDMALMPLRAVMAAAYPRFFRAGSSGLEASLRLVRRLAAPTVGYCALASAGLFVLAGLVPLLLGHSYDASVGALRGLAVLPLLKVVHYLAADALTGAGLQAVRSAWQLGVAGANAALCLLLIPSHGLDGAVVASVVSDGALAVGLWGVIARRRRRGP